jgi:hypothetical protein
MEDVKEAARRAAGTLDTIAKTLDDSAHPEAAVIRKMAAKESADLMASLVEPQPGAVVDAAAHDALKAKADKEAAAAKAKADQDERDKQAADAERMRKLQADAAKKQP